MTRRHITAPQLDELFARLTPEVAAALQARQPAGYVDQLGAARADAVRFMERAEDRRVGYVPRTSVDEWIRLSALDTLITWVSGRGRVCMHAPDWRRPEPVFSAAWKPGLVLCAQCLHLLDVTGAADKTCDRCGYIVEGTDVDDPIYTTTAFIGGLAFLSATCSGCRPLISDEGAA